MSAVLLENLKFADVECVEPSGRHQTRGDRRSAQRLTGLKGTGHSPFDQRAMRTAAWPCAEATPAIRHDRVGWSRESTGPYFGRLE
jgi:hypothetical protein